MKLIMERDVSILEPRRIPPPPSLQYARPAPGTTVNGFVSLIVGLCSGPVGVALLVAFIALSENTVVFGVLAMLSILGCSFAFACHMRSRLSPSVSWTEKSCGNLAIAAPIAWVLTIGGLYGYLCTHC